MPSKTRPKYPIYVISKGRWETRLTAKSLDEIHVPYHIVVEPQEFDAYAEVIDAGKILVTPFSDLNQGSIPARNFVWEHALTTGAKRHWILDDNIDGFYRMHKNKQTRLVSGVGFRIVEDFTDRWLNVGLSGMQYKILVPACQPFPPFDINTRIYSCILIRNDLPHRWRGRYNEDTDLSLRVLKDGWCTLLVYAILCGKVTTMIMKGGNTDKLYQGDGRFQMAVSLQKQHPDVVKVVRKWGRWQHSVDYRGFAKNKLKRNPRVKVQKGPNNYGMVLRRKT